MTVHGGLIVAEKMTLLMTGKVVVLVTVRVVSIHLTQAVLTKAFAWAMRLLKATCLASFAVVAAFVVVAARLAFRKMV